MNLFWIYILGVALAAMSLSVVSSVNPGASDISNGSIKTIIHIKAFTPYYADLDRLSYRAALDTGLEFLHKNTSILPNHNIQVHYSEDYRKYAKSMNEVLTTVRRREYAIQHVIGPFIPPESFYLTQSITEFLNIPINNPNLNAEQSTWLALVLMLRYFNWKRVALISNFDSKETKQKSDEMVSFLERRGVEVLVTELSNVKWNFVRSPFDGTYFPNVVKKIKSQDIRIVILNQVNNHFLTQVACAFTKEGMTFPRFQFISVEYNGLNLMNRTEFQANQNMFTFFATNSCPILSVYETLNNLVRIGTQQRLPWNRNTDYAGKNVKEVFDKMDEIKTRNHQQDVDRLLKETPDLKTAKMRKAPVTEAALHLVDLIYRIGLAFHDLLKIYPEEDVLLNKDYRNKSKVDNFRLAFESVVLNGVSVC